MKADGRMYDIFGKKLQMLGGVDGAFALAWMSALELSAMGTKLLSVAGTAIAGTLSGDDKIFTRTAGFFVRSQTLTVGTVTGTDTDATFRIGEGVTQTGSGAKGIVRSVNPGESSTVVVVDTITVALFVGADDPIVGDDSTVSAPVTAFETTLLDLSGQLVFAHKTGDTTDGNFVHVLSNTSNAVTTSEAMMSGATSIILFEGEAEARNATEIGLLSDSRPLPTFVAAATNVTMAGTTSRIVQIVLADTGASAVAVTLPDVRIIPDDHEIVIVGIDATTNALTVVAHDAPQTLDGTDISSGGTPYAALDADGDAIAIQRKGGVWVTVASRIQ